MRNIKLIFSIKAIKAELGTSCHVPKSIVTPINLVLDFKGR